MKRNFIHIVNWTLFLTAVLGACTRSEQPLPSVQEEPQNEQQTVCRMILNGSINLWDATKANTDWVDGTTIYIGLSNDTSVKKVAARFFIGDVDDPSDDEWRLTYDGSIANYSSGDCVCYYFEGKNYENTTINLSWDSVIYADLKAKFSIVGNSLQVSANLIPFTGRIKFVFPQYYDRSRYYPNISGVSYYSQVNLNTFEFTTSKEPFSYELRSDSDTYMYVWESNADRKITVWDSNYMDYIYTRSFKEEVFDPGKSSWLYWPTGDYHNGWDKTSYSIDDFDGNFRYVFPGTFDMGGDDAQPIHQVTITKPFYISKTEVRQSTWTEITGESYDPDLWYNSIDLPAFGKTWDQVANFIRLFTEKYSGRGYTFRLPTEAEWEFCAKSGIYHNSNIYATTNNYNELVWDGATEQPESVWSWWGNGLSMYNVCGNVSEWVSDWYAEYTDEAVQDPTGPATGTKHIKRGGARNSDPKFLTVTYRDAEESNNSMAGLRLVMEVNQ